MLHRFCEPVSIPQVSSVGDQQETRQGKQEITKKIRVKMRQYVRIEG